MPTITVDMNARCAECRKAGRCDNGLCMPCTTKAMDQTVRFRSAEGRAVQARWQNMRTPKTVGDVIAQAHTATEGDAK